MGLDLVSRVQSDSYVGVGMADNGCEDIAQVIVDDVPEEHKDAVQQAAEECPVEAIIVE